MTKFDREMGRFARHLERWAERTLPLPLRPRISLRVFPHAGSVLNADAYQIRLAPIEGVWTIIDEIGRAQVGAEKTLEVAGFGATCLAVNERLFSLYRGEFMAGVGDVIDATGGPIPPMLGGQT